MIKNSLFFRICRELLDFIAGLSVIIDNHVGFKSGKKFNYIVINTIYILVISIPVTLLVLFILFFGIIMSSFFMAIEIHYFSFLIVPKVYVINLLLLVGIVVLNIENKDFSLPKSFFKIYLICKQIHFKPITYKLVSFLLITACMFYLINSLLNDIFINADLILVVLNLFLVLGIFTIISQAIEDEIEKLKSQLVLWGFLFFSLIIFTFYFFNISMDILTEEYMIQYVLMFINIFFSFSIILDTSRKIYKGYSDKYRNEIDKQWHVYSEKYYQRAISIFEEYKKSFNEFKKQWKKASKKRRLVEVFRALFFVTLILGVYWISNLFFGSF